MVPTTVGPVIHSTPHYCKRAPGGYLIMFPVTGFPNWKYVAILASFLAPVKLSERKYFSFVSKHLVIN